MNQVEVSLYKAKLLLYIVAHSYVAPSQTPVSYQWNHFSDQPQHCNITATQAISIRDYNSNLNHPSKIVINRTLAVCLKIQNIHLS